MARLLLTSSQVSVLLSCTLAFLFFLGVFSSGLYVQRRNLNTLTSNLSPNLPPPPPQLIARQAESDITPLRIAGRPGSLHHGRFQTHKAAQHTLAAQAGVDWTGLAHVQVTYSHRQVCSSLMLFASLHKLRSPARRVLLFPAEWVADMHGWHADLSDPWLATTRRLLKSAARRYRVELVPVGSVGRKVAGTNSWFGGGVSKTETLTGEEELRVNGLADVAGLSEMKRALLLRTPGWVLDASVLDGLLAYEELDGARSWNSSASPEGILLVPGQQFSERLRNAPSPATRSARLDSILDSLPSLDFIHPHLVSDGAGPIASLGDLHNILASSAFKQNDILDTTAYLTFSNDKILGPEYDVPFKDKLEARPTNKEADWLWTKMHTAFAESRREVCGLGLETWYGD